MVRRSLKASRTANRVRTAIATEAENQQAPSTDADRPVASREDDDDGRTCGKCGDGPTALSSRGWCDGCEAEACDPVDDELEDDAMTPIALLPPPAPPVAPLRSKAYKPGHRVIPEKKNTGSVDGGSSWWMGKSREQLAAESTKRSEQMSVTRQATFVKSVGSAEDRHRDEPRARRRC